MSVSAGGVGRNIAENLARLGAAVQLVSVLGDDHFSGFLKDSCRSAGVGLDGALRLRDSPSSRYLCLLDSDGGLVGAVAAMDAIEALVPARLAERTGLLDSAALILVDANVPEASIEWLAARYRGRERPLLGFDPVSERKAGRGRKSLAAFAFAKPNRDEAALLAGLPAGTEPLELASRLRGAGLGEAFVSLGPGGLVAEGPAPGGAGTGGARERWRARLPAGLPAGLARVNASGAGDAACAAIAWGLLEGRSLGERCSLAVAAALIASDSESPVNPQMSAALLAEAAEGIEHERLP